MGNAFQDQLLKAGLVDKKKVKQAKKDQYKKTKQQGNKTTAEDKSTQLAKQAMAEKIERDRELNRQKKEEAERKAIQAQIRQLISSNAIAEQDGEIAYNFTDDGVVKKLYVDDATQRQIINGRLSIVRLDDSYKLVPTVVADKIAQRDASYLVLQNDQTSTELDEDDPYADYKIPDDLMW